MTCTCPTPSPVRQEPEPDTGVREGYTWCELCDKVIETDGEREARLEHDREQGGAR